MVLGGAEPRDTLAAHLEARHALREALLSVRQQRRDHLSPLGQRRLLRLGQGCKWSSTSLSDTVRYPFLDLTRVSLAAG